MRGGTARRRTREAARAFRAAPRSRAIRRALPAPDALPDRTRSFGRRAYRRPAPNPSRVLRSFDLGDLELALRTARHLDGDDVAALVTDQRFADRRLVRELRLRGIGLGRADDLELLRIAGLLVLDVNLDADANRVRVELLLVDDGRATNALLELGDPTLEQRLLVLGVVVLGVLHDVAELPRLLDARGNLPALHGGQICE